MDPSVCLEEVFEWIADGDYGEARCSLDDLNGWILKGGFLPNFPDSPDPLTREEYASVFRTLDRIIRQQEDLGNA